MHRGSAGDKRKSDEADHVEIRHPQLVDLDLAAFEVQMVTNGVGDRFGLLKDLLEHEMRIASALGRFPIPGDANRRALNLGTLESPDRHSAALHDRDLPVVEDNHVSSATQKCGDVRRHERFVISVTDHQR